jgi:hypothetical protein
MTGPEAGEISRDLAVVCAAHTRAGEESVVAVVDDVGFVAVMLKFAVVARLLHF